MPVLSTSHDTEQLTVTVIADLAAPPTRAWLLWSDPRQLERWWGPPTWPATFTEHDLRTGGRAAYHMTGPNGEKSHGWFEFIAIDEPRSLELEDGFADQEGNPVDSMPRSRMRVTFEPDGERTRMTITSRFASLDDLQKVLTMGMEEGIRLAVGQIDDLLRQPTPR